MTTVFLSCRRCEGGPYYRGRGIIDEPGRRWWQFWRMITCPACGGDGMAKPPGWPDPAEIERRRPKYVSGPRAVSMMVREHPNLSDYNERGWPSPAHSGVRPGDPWPPPRRTHTVPRGTFTEGSTMRSLVEGQLLQEIICSTGDEPRDTVALGPHRIFDAHEMVVCLELGPQGSTPWARVTMNNGRVQMINLQHAISVTLAREASPAQPMETKGPVAG